LGGVIKAEEFLEKVAIAKLSELRGSEDETGGGEKKDRDEKRGGRALRGKELRTSIQEEVKIRTPIWPSRAVRKARTGAAR